MKDTNLISLLRTFSKNEITKFEKFLSSPFFSEGRSIRSRIVNDYFRQLKKFHPSFSGNNFTKEKLFRAVYSGIEFNDSLFRKLNSDLLKQAERFLIQIELEMSRMDSGKFLLTQLMKREQEKLFDKCFKAMISSLSGLKKDQEFFYETYYLWQKKWEVSYGRKNIYKIENEISQANNYFYYVILGSLRIYLWAISNFRIMNKDNDLMMFEEILNYVENNIDKFREVPQILYYYFLIRMIIGKEEIYFKKLKVLKKKEFDFLSDLDKMNFFVMMTNFCHDKYSSGSEKYRIERFELDKEYLAFIKKIDKPVVHVFFILAASKNANRLGEFAWVRKVLKEYESYIMNDNKDFMLNYIEADNCFHNKNYDEAIGLLSQIKTSYSNEKQNIRNLMIQIFYERSQADSVLSLIDTSRHFLKRDKHLTEISKRSFQNFLKFTGKLIKASNSGNSKECQFLKKNILESNEVSNKDWLLEKVNQLIEY